jgi:hypothetical protein
MPDITIANLFGVRVVIEGKIGSGGPIQYTLAEQAKKRIEDGIAPLCIAVLYPNSLRTVVSLKDLKINLERTSFSVAAFWSNDHIDWTNQTVDGLTEILRRSYGLLVSEDIVAESVNEIEEVIESCAESMASVPSIPHRIRTLLGIPPERLEEPEGIIKTSRIAALSLINACIFHQVVAERDSRIQMLGRITSENFVAESLARDWQKILNEIDYKPIFNLANEIIKELRGLPQLDHKLKDLCDVALRITTRKTALKHDLMGRIYHRLLADAKYFGAFYTSVNAATLLTSLAFESLTDTIDWSDLTSVEKFKISDLACGTGTLLKSVFHEVEDNYVQSTAQQKKTINLESLHRCVLQECLWGFDVVPFAIHLAASALAIHNPEVLFEKLRLYTLPLGIIQNQPQLGSLDFLTNRSIGVQADLFGAPSAPGRITGEGELSQSVVVPLLDLCIMNPPYTRSVGGNLLFGNAPESERNRMQKHLRRTVNRNRINADITAGLASVFVALAVQLTKKDGVIALVLPRAFLTGSAWAPTRNLLGSNFHIRYIVVSHEPGNWCFSESTSLSECLIVARHLRVGEMPESTRFVNLWSKPKNSFESLAISNSVQQSQGASLRDSSGVETIEINETKFGEVVLGSVDIGDTGHWGLGVAFAQTDLSRTACYLSQGEIYLPGEGHVGDIPVVKLESIGLVGPDRRDVHDGFKECVDPTPYPAIWGHNTETIQCIFQGPNKYLTPLARARARRRLHPPEPLWQKSGRLLIAERMRLTTIKAFSIITPTPVLSNTWWPVTLYESESGSVQDAEQILALWLNSTLGIISIIASRVETEGAWIDLKKATVSSMLVLNPFALDASTKKILTNLFSRIAEDSFRRLPEIAEDETRSQIDLAISQAFGISGNVKILREMLSREPSISGRLPD